MHLRTACIGLIVWLGVGVSAQGPPPAQVLVTYDSALRLQAWRAGGGGFERVWQAQPTTFFAQAVVDADGTIAETTGECKEGMDMSFKGEWGYQQGSVDLA